MAGLWFNGVMGTFSAYAVMGVGGASRQEVPPRLDGGASRQVNNNTERYNLSNSRPDTHNTTQQYARKIDYGSVPNGPTDTTKTTGQSDMGAAVKISQYILQSACYGRRQNF